MGGHNSVTLPIHCGVPQGSILGPLLFNIFINDLTASSSQLKFILFADDTTLLFFSGSSINNVVQILNNELSNVFDWTVTNELNINISKTNSMLFCPTISTNLVNFQIFINKISIPRVSSLKFLGIIISSNLSWKEHIVFIAKKISRSLGIINKLKSLFLITNSIILNLYYTLIYPYLIYCVIIWGKNIKSHISILSKCQNSFIRILLSLPKSSHTSSYLHSYKILSIQQIYTLRILIFFYKLIILKLYPYFNSFLHKSTSIISKVTRHTWEFYIYPHRTICFSHSIFVHGVKLWSKLPHNLKILSSLSAFKNSFITLVYSNFFFFCID